MLDRPSVTILPLFGLLLAGCLLISPRFAHAQSTGGEDKWAVVDVTAAINRALEESKGGVELREKVVRRFSECSLMYGALSQMATNPEAKKSYFQAQISTMESQAAIAEQLPLEKYKEIMDSAKPPVAKLVDDVKKHDDKELASFLKICKSLNEAKEIRNAVRELSRQ